MSHRHRPGEQEDVNSLTVSDMGDDGQSKSSYRKQEPLTYYFQ